ncbi:MAG: ABC transporter permease [Treponema sp.]|jgi:ABC-type dipeptide/oligopeptide/nickel transport system permease component|nr:ABC transporter permease [Treponema sp.]
MAETTANTGAVFRKDRTGGIWFFLGRRLSITLLTLFLVSLVTFLAFALIPGDPALLVLGIEASNEQVLALRIEMGLDKSLPEQYWAWLGKFLSGDLGNSARFRGASIAGLILERLPVTFSLAILSLVFMLLIAVPAVLVSVKKEGGIADRILNTLTALNISFPGFFLGVLFIWIFGIVLRLFVPGAYIDYRQDPLSFAAYLVFPALTLALPNAAILVKFLRAQILQQLKLDYVRSALARGAGRRQVLYGHVLKNAAIPGITLLGMIVGEIFAGSIVIEQVFAIPGIGRLLISSITSRDYSTVQTLVVYMAFMVVLSNTLADIIIRIIDPRISAGSGGAS